MQSSSIINSCYSISYPLSNFSPSQQFFYFYTKKYNHIHFFPFSSKLKKFNKSWRHSSTLQLQAAATQEHVETSPSAPRFVETGYIYGVHGLQGEVRVKTNTDFPDLRFSKSGPRWLRQQVSGTDALQEIQLLEGRGHPGQSWIVRFNNVDTIEQAQKLVGSVILVKDEDRPVLEEGEFYTYDLIGMKVILKESGESVGTIINVFNSGASDLLRVKLNSTKAISNQVGESEQVADDSGPLVWVPFVESIVPIVDMEKREMLITPPKGLLELNIRTDERSKKERRELEWKEKKKFQRRLIAAKKKLIEMEQQHVFHGFRYGEKDKTSLLANQIVTVNSKLLQQALQNIETPSPRHNLLQILGAVPRSNTLKVSNDSISAGSRKPSDSYPKLHRKGQLLTSDGKASIFLVLQEMEEINQSPNDNLVDSEGNDKICQTVKTFLDDHEKFIKIEDRSNVPLVLIGSAHSVNSLQEMFSVNDYFAFDPEKVWFLKEEKLPVVSSPDEGHEKHKILMKSPWEILQRPIGSGGVFSLLSSQDLLDKLSEMGVEYIEMCSLSRTRGKGHALLGLVDSCNANVGIQISDSEDDFSVILSMSFLKRLATQMNKLQFHAVRASNSYVEQVDKDWVDVIPSSHNSYEFHCSIYSCLNASPINKVCVLDSTD